MTNTQFDGETEEDQGEVTIDQFEASMWSIIDKLLQTDEEEDTEEEEEEQQGGNNEI